METARLLLRRHAPDDIDAMYAILSDPEVVKFEPYPPMTRDEAKKDLAWRISTDEAIAVVRKSDGRVIGSVYFGKRACSARELGYLFAGDCWGRGYATEACRAIIERAFSMGLHRIYAECDPMNPPSWRLLERLGMRKEAHLKRNVWFEKDEAGAPIWKDTYIYARLNGE